MNAVVVSDLILAADVSSGSWFRLAETVLASLAKCVVACWTAATDEILEEELDEDPDAAFAVPPLIWKWSPLQLSIVPKMPMQLLIVQKMLL